jgi:hypothetical protein
MRRIGVFINTLQDQMSACRMGIRDIFEAVDPACRMGIRDIFEAVDPACRMGIRDIFEAVDPVAVP